MTTSQIEIEDLLFFKNIHLFFGKSFKLDLVYETFYNEGFSFIDSLSIKYPTKTTENALLNISNNVLKDVFEKMNGKITDTGPNIKIKDETNDESDKKDKITDDEIIEMIKNIIQQSASSVSSSIKPEELIQGIDVTKMQEDGIKNYIEIYSLLKVIIIDILKYHLNYILIFLKLLKKNSTLLKLFLFFEVLNLNANLKKYKDEDIIFVQNKSKIIYQYAINNLDEYEYEQTKEECINFFLKIYNAEHSELTEINNIDDIDMKTYLKFIIEYFGIINEKENRENDDEEDEENEGGSNPNSLESLKQKIREKISKIKPKILS